MAKNPNEKPRLLWQNSMKSLGSTAWVNNNSKNLQEMLTL
jgi:hypothetical protein